MVPDEGTRELDLDIAVAVRVGALHLRVRILHDGQQGCGQLAVFIILERLFEALLAVAGI